jgi:hypothetical protein
MKLHMTRNTESWIRLGVGAVLNVCLWLSNPLQRLSGGYDRKSHMALIAILFAVPALVPVFWRGQPSHALIAFVLAVQPAFCIIWALSLL